MVTVLNQNFGQSECQTIDLVDIALEEQNTTLLVRNRSAVRQLRCRAKAVQDRLFVVVTGDTVFLAENTRPFVFTLVIDSIEAFVEDRLNDTTEVRTAHWCCHFVLLLIKQLR
ncbi:MAG: hypothetical protein EBT06_10485 [Gammaproteobacteria bacterium]|nr:hypothetical protein [Gammaproteobacteria bacterium]